MHTFVMQSNFEFLDDLEPTLYELGKKCERYFTDDPSTCLFILRQFCEILTQNYAKLFEYRADDFKTQLSLLQKLDYDNKLPKKVADALHHVRKIGNDAVHNKPVTNEDALTCLKLGVQLAYWYANVAFDEFEVNAYVFKPPKSPAQVTQRLQREIMRLERELEISKQRLNEVTLNELMVPASEAPPRMSMNFMSFKTAASPDKFAELLKKAKIAANNCISYDLAMQQDIQARNLVTQPWDDDL